MSFPIGRVRWTPLPGERAHVVVEDVNGVPIMCGSITLEWIKWVPGRGSSADMSLCRIEDCDHAGTHRNPRSVWTGELSP